MNKNTFDLDIINYNINDLINLLKINDDYSEEDVVHAVANIKNKIKTYDDKQFYNNFNVFIEKAKQKLVDNLYPVIDNQIINANDNDSKNVLQHKDKYYKYTNPSNYYAGIINPLNTRIIHKYISIDSKFRDNPNSTSSSDFFISLPSKIKGIVSMQITSFEIPISFYGISESYGNNYFTMIITDVNNNEYKRTLIIEEGNYTPFSLIDYLNKFLSPKDDNGNFINLDDLFNYVLFTVDIHYDGTGTGKCKVGTLNEQIKYIKLDFTYNYSCGKNNSQFSSKFGNVLGFTKDVYEEKTEYTAETIMDVFPYKYIYLAIDDFNNNFSYLFLPVYKQSTTFSSTIIAKIPVNSEYFTVMTENNLKIITDERQYFGPVDIDRLRITLLDEYGNVLNINNSNYSFCILVKKIYDL